MTVRTIVVGTDGSLGGAGAVRWSAALAAQVGADVVAVHAYSPLDELATASPGTELSVLAARAEARLRDEWCAPLIDAGVAHRSRLVEDLPVDGLVAVAAEESADLLVVGSHGTSGWRERILGSVATGLPNHAPCPVVIVPLAPPSPD
jgi:nucleotide-binding universal stress UspA family protein